MDFCCEVCGKYYDQDQGGESYGDYVVCIRCYKQGYRFDGYKITREET